ncbi:MULTISPECIES: hypothetical protein [Enorma]|uniref:hypothetical protein n=1 Tax=Enorma TaxID=1472762 RepID=UPI000346F6B3|nr:MULTISPECIES: hypothetical protein [Enorma]
MNWGWYSYDMDADENDYESGADSYPTNDGDTDYCAKTVVYGNGTVAHFEGIDGDFETGHTHEVYSDLDSYMYGGEPTWSRDADDPESYGRDWTER